ncbi:prephenate dehydrogenase [Desulfotomaculum copahuensis]|uniref:Prephenate dehydrogenase n=1 Tax=Desulfotomaculum copahuensis TaxID=1838280 RepID=A0A1B7LIL6_9FIRM|nr:prephenate dehydrogenase [Desulfotomaculum copahuensis]OAT86415.1 prephenate dehydrogenase [Desulfotomaculum copahuensis]
MFEKVSIIGVGLIGGSLGMALCGRKLARRVTGADPDPENRRLALERGAVHQVCADPGEAVRGAELVVLATPVGCTMTVLAEILPRLEPGTVVTDVGSVKASIAARAAAMMPDGVWFVGGHPMAGSEQTGCAGADPFLFENAYYIITPARDVPEAVLKRMQALIAGVGARMVRMHPEEHDRAVAAVSHLPHLIAATLVNTLAILPDRDDFLPLAAGGFRDTTRVAASGAAMWRDIFLANRRAVLDVLAVFRRQLQALEDAVGAGDGPAIADLLERARQVRHSLPARARGYLPALFELVATVPDRPGMIADLAAPLGRAGINITDIEILRVREGEGGTIRLAFATEEDRDAAVAVLKKEGIQAAGR